MARPVNETVAEKFLTSRGRQKIQMLTLNKGTEITCPGCKALICTAAEDIKPGMKLATWRFVFSQDGHEPGQKFECKACGEAFYDDLTGKLHTPHGWL